MPQTFRGELTAAAANIAIVVSRYNESVTGRLLAGAVETLAPRRARRADHGGVGPGRF